MNRSGPNQNVGHVDGFVDVVVVVVVIFMVVGVHRPLPSRLRHDRWTRGVVEPPEAEIPDVVEQGVLFVITLVVAMEVRRRGVVGKVAPST